MHDHFLLDAGPNHNWLAPSIRDLSDNLDTLTNDVIKAINEIPPEGSDGPHLDELNELFDVVNFDLRELLDNFVGVVNDVTTQSTELSSVLEGSRQAFSTFTLSYADKIFCIKNILHACFVGMTQHGVGLMPFSVKNSIPCSPGNGGHVIT